MDGSPPRSPGPGPHGGRGTVVGTKYNTAENGYALLIRGNTDGTEITYSVQNGSAAHSVMADGMVTLHQQVDVLTIRGQPETAHTIIFWSRSIPPQVLATLTATHYQPMTSAMPWPTRPFQQQPQLLCHPQPDRICECSLQTRSPQGTWPRVRM